MSCRHGRTGLIRRGLIALPFKHKVGGNTRALRLAGASNEMLAPSTMPAPTVNMLAEAALAMALSPVVGI